MLRCPLSLLAREGGGEVPTRADVPLLLMKAQGPAHLVESRTRPKVSPLDSVNLFPSSDVISTFYPQITRKYPDMNLELQGTVVSTPLLHISPGNLSLAPQMEIEGFVLLPSSTREPVFRLGVVRLRAFAKAVPLH